MPEVERPKFRKDAKPTKRSYKGKGVGVGRGDSAENLIDGADWKQSPP